MMGYIEAGLAPLRNTGDIKLHGAEAFEGMRRAGQVTAEALDMVTGLVQPGVTTAELDRAVLDFALAHDALPATLYYRGYSHSSCISLNHVVCHGIPGSRALRIGDILNIDITLIVDGWHGDSSRMYTVG
ncbi:MAG: M24 family metallopeptidase, partial [Hyphomicrobiales bacterium]